MKNSNGMWLRGVCAVLALGFSAAQAATGVWVNVTGGYWAEAENWQDGFVPSAAPDVADFSALGSGETVTVTNDTGIGAMVFSGAADAAWSVQAENGARLGFDTTPLTPDFAGGEIRVSGGTLTLWPGWYYARNGVVKSGSGRVRLVNRYATDFKGDTRLDGGTLILSNNAALVDSVVVMNATNAVLLLESDAQINGVSSLVSPAPDIALNGYSLEIGGPDRSLEWEGRLTGGGRLVMVRGALQALTETQDGVGTVCLDNGSLTLGKRPGRTVAWWRFDDESNIGKDSGTLGNGLVPVGSPTQWHVVDPERGSVLSLDNGAYLAGQGADKEVAGLPVNNGPFTVAFWLKPAADVPDLAGLFGWGTYNVNYRCNMMRLNIPTSSNPLMHTNWANNREVPSPISLKDGNWHHVAVVYTGEKISFYIDGVLRREDAQTVALEVRPGNFTIGRVWSTHYYKGLIDDFVIADWAMGMGDIETIRLDGQEPGAGTERFNNLLPAETKVEVGYNGFMHLTGDQTVATLGGGGAAGGVTLAGGGVLTAAGCGYATSTVFNAAISGEGALVKSGAAYTLTLGGGHSYTGATAVQEGTLALARRGASGLQAYYRFDDPTALGKDSSGNGYHLAPSNSPVFVTAGKTGGAAGFSTASKDTLVASVFPATLPTGNSSYTVAAWCNPSSGNTKGLPVYWGGLVSSPNGSASLFRFESTTQIMVSNFGNNQTVDAGYDLFADTLNGGWHHIACTYDGATRMRRVYIDGVQKYAGTHTTDLVVTNRIFQLGGAPYSTANYYDGLLDEVMIFDRALGSGEIQSAMTASRSGREPLQASASLVARYSFEDTLNPGKDSGAHGYDLAAFGSAGVTLSGKRGKALDLSGSTIGYLAWTNSVFPELMPTGNQAVTISAWINPKTGADTEGSVVFWGDVVPGTKSCHLLRLRGGFASGRIGISYTDGTTPNVESDAVNGLDRGNAPEGWHHIAAVYAGGARSLYVDGVMVAWDTRSGLVVTNAYYYIGRKSTPTDKWFQGLIDEVEIYNRALSHAEVLELLRGGMDILPAGSALDVAAGATVEVNDAVQQVAALGGDGTVSFRFGVLTVAGQGGSFAGALAGEGAFAVRDGAVQTLAGAGTFSGTVAVSNATLLVENESGTVTAAGSATVVQSGGRVGGRGTLGGELAFEDGGGIVAGAAPGALAVTGAVTLGAAGTVVLPPEFTGGKVTLLNAASVTAPDGLADWAVEPQQPASMAVAFRAEGTQFTLNVFRRGTMIRLH